MLVAVTMTLVVDAALISDVDDEQISDAAWHAAREQGLTPQECTTSVHPRRDPAPYISAMRATGGPMPVDVLIRERPEGAVLSIEPDGGSLEGIAPGEYVMHADG